MKYKWLNKQNNDKLIVFFNGWGMYEGIVAHLEPENFDIIMFYDYNNLDTDFMPEKYSETHIIAWSMGVMVGTVKSEMFSNICSSTAINGTLKPVDVKYGINPRVYDLTIRGFSEESRDKFVKNMFDKTGFSACSCKGRSDSLELLRNELSAIKTYTANEDFKYTKILISDNDKIIPTKSQCAYWGIEPNLNGGHCPFLQFAKWSELL